MATYRVHYLDRAIGDDRYDWTRQDFYTFKEALRFARSCYERAVEVELLEPGDSAPW